MEETSTIEHGREVLIDFVRGLTIINMYIVHFQDSLPVLFGGLIDFPDLAVESFIFLAGFMVGRHYLVKFENNSFQVTKSLWSRAFKILIIHYIMIVTIGIPFYAYFRLDGYQQLYNFVASSTLFLNQIPILHILPTFIPLFLLSPLVLVFLERQWDVWLLVASVVLFLIGNAYPNPIGHGDTAIFPVSLWQTYFVVGCCIGKTYHKFDRIDVRKFFLYALAIFIVCAFVKFGGYFQWMNHLKATLNLYPKKFPLNIYGLVYGMAFLALFYASALYIWEKVKHYRLFGEIIPLFGRNSLAAFVIHAYFVYIVAAMQESAIHRFAILGVAIASFYFTYTILSYIGSMTKTDSQENVS